MYIDLHMCAHVDTGWHSSSSLSGNLGSSTWEYCCGLPDVLAAVQEAKHWRVEVQWLSLHQCHVQAWLQNGWLVTKHLGLQSSWKGDKVCCYHAQKEDRQVRQDMFYRRKTACLPHDGMYVHICAQMWTWLLELTRSGASGASICHQEPDLLWDAVDQVLERQRKRLDYGRSYSQVPAMPD